MAICEPDPYPLDRKPAITIDPEAVKVAAQALKRSQGKLHEDAAEATIRAYLGHLLGDRR